VPLDGALRLGSNRQQNDVWLPLRSVEPFHAEILGSPDGSWEVVALGLRRLKVGDTMTARARLSAGTEFSVGPVAFRVRPAEQAARPVSSTGPRRTVLPPPPPPAASRAPALAVAILVAAAGVLAWAARREPGADAPANVPARRFSEAPSGASAAKPPSRASLLEAGSIATATPGAESDPAAPPTILVKVGGNWAPVRGFFVSRDGLLVTNEHLASAAEAIVVRAAGWTAPAAARVVAADPVRDLALLAADVAGPVTAAGLDDDDALRAAAKALGVPPADVRAFVAGHR
jgi:S1-C subfamily serine protease